MALHCKVEKEIAIISTKGNTEKALTLTSWNDNPAKYDLRIWREQDGEKLPGKGITLDSEEILALAQALSNENLTPALKESADNL